MALDVKICGLKTADAFLAAQSGGARWAGFVFYEKSPRYVSPAEARVLSDLKSGSLQTVGVYVDADDALFAETASAVDWFQLHGSELPERALELRKRHGRKIIKAIKVHTSDDIKSADAFKDVADMILFDAKPAPDALLPGGNGRAFDWHLLQHQTMTLPWILSGGIDERNLQQALSTSAAYAVDISSGVESSPGTKDLAKITRFLERARTLTAKEHDA